MNLVNDENPFEILSLLQFKEKDFFLNNTTLTLFNKLSIMSHLNERIEKDCLNCGSTVSGRFCNQCGQENVEVKESFWHLIMHFVEDITHFDGKLWGTLKLLLFKPGKLTQLYMDGKRASYIHPIRLYIFISAIFFLYINFNKSTDFKQKIDNKKDVAKVTTIQSKRSNDFYLNYFGDTLKFKTVKEYDSIQYKLSKHQRDNWFVSILTKKYIEIASKYNYDFNEILVALIEQFKHYFSRIFYISLPMFALFLWVLYRRNKNYFFVDHLIFSIHVYCAFFVLFFASGVFNSIINWIFPKLSILISLIFFVLTFFYLYKALKNHFSQSRIKTILKFLILNVLTFILMYILITSFFWLFFINL